MTLRLEMSDNKQMSSQVVTAAERFRVIMDELLQFIHTLLEELTLDNMIDDIKSRSSRSLTSINPSAVTIARALLKGYDPEVVIQGIASCHQDWDMVLKKDPAIVGSLKTMFDDSELAFDVNILLVPFAAYEVVKTSNEWKDLPEDQLPVNKEDIDQIWVFLTSIISVTCSYVHEKRVPVIENGKLVRYDNPDFLDYLDLEKYVEMFRV